MRLITRDEAAEVLGISMPTLARYLRDGKLTKYKQPGGYYVRIDADEVQRLLNWQPAR